MTAVLVQVRDDSVSLITDGAFFRLNNECLAIARKMLLFPRQGYAVAPRGRLPASGLLSAWTPPHSFDEIVLHLPELLRMTIAASRREGVTPEDRLELTVAGWSHLRGRAEAWACSDVQPGSRDGASLLDGYAPGRAMRLPPFWAGAGNDRGRPFSRYFAERAAALAHPVAPATFGAEMMQEVRHSVAAEHGRPGAIVGGCVEMAQVARDGLRASVLGRWEQDRPGRHLDRGAPFSAALSQTAEQDLLDRWAH